MTLKLPSLLGISSKIFFIIFLSLAIILCLTNTFKVYAAGGVTISGQPSTINVASGNSFTVNIVMNTNGDSVSAAEVHINYDSAALQGQTITAGSLLPVVLLPGTIGNGTATITLGSQPTTPTSGTGTLVSVTFKALKFGNTSITLANTTQTASIGKTGNTVGTLSPSTVTVSGITNPSPTSTPQSTTIPSSQPTSTPNPVASIVSLGMTPANVATTVGTNFSVALTMNTSTDHVSATELHLVFDKTKLQAQSITAGTFLPILLATGVVNNTAGTATITLGSNPSSPVTGVGTLATITFKALTSGMTALTYDPTTATASIGKTGNSVSTLSGSDITISATPLPTPTPTPKPTLAASGTPNPTSTIDRVRPKVKITNPSQGATVLRSTNNHPSIVTFGANAFDEHGIKRVLFFVNGVRVCNATESPYSCNWKVPGNKRHSIYTLTVLAFDSAGNSAIDNISVMAK